MRIAKTSIALCLGLLAGCTTVPTSLIPFYEPPIPSSASLTPPPNPRIPRQIPILDTPRLLHVDTVHPPFLTRQKLRWDGEGLDWRMRFPARRYAYAGFVLRRPIDIKDHHTQMRLVFKMRPARLAAFLSVGLMDHPSDDAAPALADVWLMHHAPPAGDGWTTVSVPLTAFPTGTITEDHAPAADGPAPDQHPALLRDIDWSRIQEVRIISPGGRIPADEITIRDLSLQRL